MIYETDVCLNCWHPKSNEPNNRCTTVIYNGECCPCQTFISARKEIVSLHKQLNDYKFQDKQSSQSTEVDEFAQGAKYGYRLGWVEAMQIAQRQGAEGVVTSCRALGKVNFFMGVHPREGGPYSLYCFECGKWVGNTANYESQREGCFSHSHSCRLVQKAKSK